MVSFGAILVEPGLQRSFYGRLRPISDEFIPAALAVSKLTREETLSFSRFRRPAETPFNLILEARP